MALFGAPILVHGQLMLMRKTLGERWGNGDKRKEGVIYRE